ncbi:MAG TPA: VWA domain-containing protein [Thioploca sp.]|nr:MAG: VWA domain-containing protein [Gammaproteobacteria bacterium]HDN25769.1 VWA domain-containing protein [Thioploca sp.]
MPYSAEISRANPSCVLFMIDQSFSMDDPFGGGESTDKKATAVADVINKLLQNLVIKCAKDEGVRDYYHIGVIGYGGQVGPAFGGELASKELVPISQIANSPARVEERTKKMPDATGELVEQTVKFPIWFDAITSGGTAMCKAMTQAKQILESWLTAHPDGYPPIVINITDGESTDGNPNEVAQAIKNLKSNHGEVLLFNIHLSSHQNPKIEFPESEAGLPDEYAIRLFQMSSVLPNSIKEIAHQEGYPVSTGARGFVFNADMTALINFLDIGTRPSNLR